MGCAAHVAHLGRGKKHTEVTWGNLKERGNWENQVADGGVTSNLIF